MKVNFFVEHNGEKISTKQIEDTFKELMKDQGKRIKDIGNVEFYYKPEEKTCYYVVLDTDCSGKIQL